MLPHNNQLYDLVIVILTILFYDSLSGGSGFIDDRLLPHPDGHVAHEKRGIATTDFNLATPFI